MPLSGNTSYYFFDVREERKSRANNRLRDGSGNWNHLNLIFPVYAKLMTGFPSFHPEDVGPELLH
jgi:hypothetical protein